MFRLFVLLISSSHPPSPRSHPLTATVVFCQMCAKKLEPTTPERDLSSRPTYGHDRGPPVLQSPLQARALSPTLVDDELEYWQGLEDGNEFYQNAELEPFLYDAEPAPPPTIIPNRWVQQARSRQGFVAYVVFVGIRTGVFYNWGAASAAIGGDGEPHIHKGYTTINDAHCAWDNFRLHNILPVGLTPLAARSRSATPRSPSYHSSPAREVARSPQAPRMPQAGIPQAHRTPQTPRMPQAGIPQAHRTPQTPCMPQAGIPQAHRTPQCSPSAPRMLQSHITPPPYANYDPALTRPSILAGTPSFHQRHHAHPAPLYPTENVAGGLSYPSSASSSHYFAVFTGTAPGVYHGRQAAEMGMGRPSAATFRGTATREEANEMFVGRYMSGHVSRFV
ncbi:hypothetical protein B0H34DRAFT_857143 [Crassisporium funariophilum]|nr:hypothetical protein B0H34DRAFT_857143 [Crassisporium funariophilum]